ncbi:hypothetical protein [Rossellomorea sp. DUT-2]|jgi:hypothetical protein|uniref:hypothetical protein n=1 Tax=Rossellomorea sp. DUT-2 TaxID=3412021 RepID=UPI002D77F697|nr:hypothetical protein [Rossellomorea aquimaris]WRP07343.1 hypothetical protein U9J35_04015 [Rossellomorea aquimaris]
MKYVISMYTVMAMMVLVNLTSEFLLNGEYSAIASWLLIALFFFGTLFFINARYVFSKKEE